MSRKENKKHGGGRGRRMKKEREEKIVGYERNEVEFFFNVF